MKTSAFPSSSSIKLDLLKLVTLTSGGENYFCDTKTVGL